MSVRYFDTTSVRQNAFPSNSAACRRRTCASARTTVNACS